MVYHQEHTPFVSWQELQMARGKLKGGKFTLVGMGWKHPFFKHVTVSAFSQCFNYSEYHIAGYFHRAK